MLLNLSSSIFRGWGLGLLLSEVVTYGLLRFVACTGDWPSHILVAVHGDLKHRQSILAPCTKFLLALFSSFFFALGCVVVRA